MVAACTYVMRTISDIAPLGDAIRLRLIPALTGYAHACPPIIRNLVFFPVA